MKRVPLCLACGEPGRSHDGVACPGFRPKRSAGDVAMDLVFGALARVPSLYPKESK